MKKIIIYTSLCLLFFACKQKTTQDSQGKSVEFQNEEGIFRIWSENNIFHALKCPSTESLVQLNDIEDIFNNATANNCSILWSSYESTPFDFRKNFTRSLLPSRREFRNIDRYDNSEYKEIINRLNELKKMFDTANYRGEDELKKVLSVRISQIESELKNLQSNTKSDSSDLTELLIYASRDSQKLFKALYGKKKNYFIDKKKYPYFHERLSRIFSEDRTVSISKLSSIDIENIKKVNNADLPNTDFSKETDLERLVYHKWEPKRNLTNYIKSFVPKNCNDLSVFGYEGNSQTIDTSSKAFFVLSHYTNSNDYQGKWVYKFNQEQRGGWYTYGDIALKNAARTSKCIPVRVYDYDSFFVEQYFGEVRDAPEFVKAYKQLKDKGGYGTYFKDGNYLELVIKPEASSCLVRRLKLNRERPTPMNLIFDQIKDKLQSVSAYQHQKFLISKCSSRYR